MVASGTKRLWTAAVASGIVVVASAWSQGGDEPSRLGRIFRMGRAPQSNASPSVGKVAPGPTPPAARGGRAGGGGRGSFGRCPPLFSLATPDLRGEPPSVRCPPGREPHADHGGWANHASASGEQGRD